MRHPLPHGLPQCGHAVTERISASFVAQRSQLFLLGIDLRHLFVHFLVGNLCAAVQIVYQLADFLVQCFALGVQIENLQVDAGRQCKVVRLFSPATPAA